MGQPEEPTTPAVARIYDYYLGGVHNYEADRQVARAVLKQFPQTGQMALHNRIFQNEMVDWLLRQGIKLYADFGSGLPTVNHLHEQLGSNAQIVYSDHDASVVDDALDIIGDAENVRYVHASAENIAPVLTVANELFTGQRRVAFLAVALIYFLPDKVLRQFGQETYDWADPESFLVISTLPLIDYSSPDVASVLDRYSKIGAKIYPRSREEIYDILAPWEPIEGGFKPLEDYAPGHSLTLDDPNRGQLGAGCVFAKR